MLVGWCVDELDLGRKLAPILLVSEDVECVFFGDVPLDGGVGAGGAHGLDLVLSGLDESFLDAFHLSCHWVGLVGALWLVRPVSFDGVGVAGAFGVDEGEAVVSVELDAVDDVGVFDGDSGDLLLVELGAGGAERGGFEARAERAPEQGGWLWLGAPVPASACCLATFASPRCIE